MTCLPRTRAMPLLALAGICCASFAIAQVLPETGSGSSVTVRPNLTPEIPPANAPNWQTTAAIGVQQQWTDDAVPEQSGRPRSSFITVVTPSLGISGESARVSGGLTYAPNFYHYESIKGQDRAAQNLNGNAHVTLYPEEVFVDLRGFAAEQALRSATGPRGTTTLDRQNLVQSYNFSVAPYVVHRFGDWGTAQVGAALMRTLEQSLGQSLPGSSSANQTLGSTQETAVFTSGEALGRVQSIVSLLAAQDTGSGALAGAARNTASYQAAYAFTHSITGLASAGYEHITYGKADPVKVNDATWSVGFKLTPNPDSSITVQYGHQDGVTAASLDASYAPTVRTKLFARYSEGITTGVEQLQNSLAAAQLDPMGNPVDSVTGAPLQLTNNFFGTSTQVVRVRSYSLTGAWEIDRDSVQVTINRQEQTPVGRSSSFGQSTGTYGSVAWQHDLREAMRSSLFVQYGINDESGGAAALSTRVLVVSAALTYALSETLSGTLEYSYTQDAYGAGLPTQAINLVAIGLRKTF